MIYRFIPKTAQTCEMKLIWLVHREALEGQDYDLEKLTGLWKVTTEKDQKIIEHASRSVRLHYFVRGPIAPTEHNELRYIGWYLEEISRSRSHAPARARICLPRPPPSSGTSARTVARNPHRSSTDPAGSRCC